MLQQVRRSLVRILGMPPCRVVTVFETKTLTRVEGGWVGVLTITVVGRDA